MKAYNVTRWLVLPVTVYCEGEAERDLVKGLTSAQFTDYWYGHTDTDEKLYLLNEVDLEEQRQEVEEIGDV